MKSRVIQRVVVFLLLGAIVNVAVAWGCSRGNVWPPKQNLTNYDTSTMWSRVAQSHWPVSPRGLDRRQRFGCRFDETASAQSLMLPDGRLERRMFLAQEVCAGWPALALSGNYGARVNEKKTTTQSADHESIQRGFILVTRGVGWLNVDPGQAFPIRPIWPGFVVNTIFYALVLWGILAVVTGVPQRYLRHRRIKRGLCPACAYPIGTSEVCTECGGTVQPRRGDGV